MKVSKRTVEARAGNMTKPHITLEDGFWDLYNWGKCKKKHVTQAIDFCRKLNKAKG